ncbi:MAG: hypothetical protein M0P71_16180 [Melioribacteraceae bacterium]|jgi:uncharacterized alpha/beta hydrolase family protein|nr:hypothetical protein [Melioribacteraceae bacterium]
MKLDNEILIIHSLRAQKETNKFIAQRLGISESSVRRISSFAGKKLSAKNTKKIQKSIKEIKQSKSKSNKTLIKYIDFTVSYLQTKKTTRSLRSTVNKLRKSEKLIKEIVTQKTKLDKRKKVGGQAYKDELKHFYTSINRGDIQLEVI